MASQFFTSEILANSSPGTLVSNAAAFTNATANAVRITFGGVSLPSVYGSVTPAESLQVSLYVGANGLSNDALLFSQTVPVVNGGWAADILVGKPRTVASNLQMSAITADPAMAITSPSTNGVMNVANTGMILSVYVGAIGGGSNGTITIETGVLNNIA